MPKLANEEIQQSFNKGLKILMNAFSAQTKEYSKKIIYIKTNYLSFTKNYV